MNTAMPNTNALVICSWNPQPSWEPPARKTSSNAGQRPERQPLTRSEDESVQSDFLAVVARLVDEAENLYPDHRKDAGHEIQNKPAHKGEQEGAGQTARAVWRSLGGFALPEPAAERGAGLWGLEFGT